MESSSVWAKAHLKCFSGKIFFVDIPGAEIYFDEMAIGGTNETEHDEILFQVMQRARENNIKFNQNKKIKIYTQLYLFIYLFIYLFVCLFV